MAIPEKTIAAMLATVREAALADDLPGAIVSGFHDVLGIDYVTYDEMRPDGATTLAEPFDAAAGEAFGRHAHEHPALAEFRRTGQTGTHRLSDLTSERKLRRLGLWSEVFRPLRIRYQLALALHGRGLIGISLSRTSREFNEDELTIAELLRVELGQIVAARTGPPPEALEEAGLTPREAQVLALAIRRRTSREIASALCISKRTVEKHLEHAYTKLGISTRREAAALLAS
ncbi:MAG TPA: LuxR C-terminal-related transcriptional regulator [Thermoleophilaceae bacterium]|nr:LuxR C-terminal-related transcriptional regulator [Thermoleophilaceae bacterium]